MNLIGIQLLKARHSVLKNYKISVENGNAVITHGKESIQVPAREEAAPNKFASTELTYKGTADLREIDLGGTTTRIVFEGAAPMNWASSPCRKKDLLAMETRFQRLHLAVSAWA